MHANMLFYSLYYDIISLISLKIPQEFHLLFDFAENQIVFCDLKIWNSVRITEGSDNGDPDNQGPTVHIYIYIDIKNFAWEDKRWKQCYIVHIALQGVNSTTYTIR